MPSITCGRPPNCTVPGATVLLVGTCSSSDAGAQLLYIVNGQISNTATCPTAGTSVVVEVKPVFPQRPECPYNASTAYTLTSARGSWVPGLGPRVSCRAHVMCLHAPMTGQVPSCQHSRPEQAVCPLLLPRSHPQLNHRSFRLALPSPTSRVGACRPAPRLGKACCCWARVLPTPPVLVSCTL